MSLLEAKRALIRERLLDALAQGATRTEACRMSGISRQTLYNWLEEDPTLLDQVLEAEQEAIQAVEAVAYRCAIKAEEDPRYQSTLRFFLKSRAGWNDRPAKPQEKKQVEETYNPSTREAILTRVLYLLKNYDKENGTPHEEDLSNEDFPDIPLDPEALAQIKAEEEEKARQKEREAARRNALEQAWQNADIPSGDVAPYTERPPQPHASARTTSVAFKPTPEKPAKPTRPRHTEEDEEHYSHAYILG